MPLGFCPSRKAANTFEVASNPAANAARAAHKDACGLKARLVPNSSNVASAPATSRIRAARVATKVW